MNFSSGVLGDVVFRVLFACGPLLLGDLIGVDLLGSVKQGCTFESETTWQAVKASPRSSGFSLFFSVIFGHFQMALNVLIAFLNIHLQGRVSSDLPSNIETENAYLLN